MKIYVINQIARDKSGCRDLNAINHIAKPFRVFTYVVVAKSPRHAVQMVKDKHGTTASDAKYTSKLSMQNWGDVFYTVQNPQGFELDEMISLGVTDISEIEAHGHKMAFNDGRRDPL